MSVKILSQSGNSLADIYNVEGSIAALGRLSTEDTVTVHELGHTIFSERLRSQIIRTSSGGIAQSTAWDNTISAELPLTPWRVLGVSVISGDGSAGEVDNLSVALRDNTTGREIPIFVWDDVVDTEFGIRLIDNGGAAGNHNFFRAIAGIEGRPSMGMGTLQGLSVNEITFRGLTNAFGAGTVTVRALIHIAFAAAAGVNSRGLPLPGW